MIIEPRTRGFICTTAHPDGCAWRVNQEVDHAVARRPSADRGPRNVLIIGASTGYGLSSRVVAGAGYGASTLGVFLERPPADGRTASAGWYNDVALRRALSARGRYATSVNGDAFTDAVKDEVAGTIARDLGQVDLVIYSLAAPRRRHPETGRLHQSVIKPIGAPFTDRSVDTATGTVSDVTLEPATEAEIEDTVAVMGGDDWRRWIERLDAENLLAPGATTVAYSYVGPRLTWPIYQDGTIGRAKADLAACARHLDDALAPLGGRALVSVSQAVVTQSSSAIPVVSLYLALLRRAMAERGLTQGCIEQMQRLFDEQLYAAGPPRTDADGLIRLDDLEQRADVQHDVMRRWRTVTTANLEEVSDIRGYRREFLQLFGFDCPSIDYTTPTDPRAPANAEPAVSVPAL